MVVVLLAGVLLATAIGLAMAVLGYLVQRAAGG
jgi:hypothetical protein